MASTYRARQRHPSAQADRFAFREPSGQLAEGQLWRASGSYFIPLRRLAVAHGCLSAASQ
eukprot:451434-Pleurochrysis_carterae.AAC.1